MVHWWSCSAKTVATKFVWPDEKAWLLFQHSNAGKVRELPELLSKRMMIVSSDLSSCDVLKRRRLHQVKNVDVILVDAAAFAYPVYKGQEWTRCPGLPPLCWHLQRIPLRGLVQRAVRHGARIPLARASHTGSTTCHARPPRLWPSVAARQERQRPASCYHAI